MTCFDFYYLKKSLIYLVFNSFAIHVYISKQYSLTCMNVIAVYESFSILLRLFSIMFLREKKEVVLLYVRAMVSFIGKGIFEVLERPCFLTCVGVTLMFVFYVGVK